MESRFSWMPLFKRASDNLDEKYQVTVNLQKQILALYTVSLWIGMPICMLAVCWNSVALIHECKFT